MQAVSIQQASPVAKMMKCQAACIMLGGMKSEKYGIKEKANGKIIYKVVDISKKENEAIADKYEVTWSSLFVNDWKDGKENVNNMTEFSFSNARNAPDKFKEGIKSKIDELLKQLKDGLSSIIIR